MRHARSPSAAVLLAGDQRKQQLERPLGGAELLANQARGTLTAGGRCGRVGKAVADEGQKLLAIGHDHGRIALQKGGNDVAEVSRVGAERHGGPIGGRLDHVLPATIAETAADKGDVGRSPPGPQLADHVDQQHAR